MGCFLACFGGEKGRKRGRKSLPRDRNRAREAYQALRTSPPPKKVAAAAKEGEVVVVPSDDPIPELRVKNQEQEEESSGGGSSSRKKVTFDLNVKTYEDPVLIHEETQCPPDEEEAKEEKNAEEESGGAGIAAPAIPVAFPANHRYGNCAGSDDEEDVVDDSDYDDDDEEEEVDYNFDDDEEEDEGVVTVATEEEESYDSFFSLPLESEKERSCQEVSSSPLPVAGPDRATARDRRRYVHPVLNPVQNLSQWKEAKTQGLPSKDPNKENIELAKNSGKENIVSESESTPMVSDTKQEISVDASLSTWLVSPQSSTTKVGGRPQESGGGSCRSRSSSVNREDRPILGALTLEDIKQSSATSSPRRSPRSPDDVPIVGSVGSYWSSEEARHDTKGIPNSTSKYREDKRVNWHSTPFEVRLERALNEEGAAEACQV
ncbi:uncharacterized protein M6B38_361635 [Iris pallida]|uniref:Uncharacterized protein n=1 Tax=Iris pallida TaxID=29817 RepID=A0AAX6GJF2_IRIPA|nr:uncharacterized protein M6B38_361635 [Iris pallida]